jgi:hypothetical protein
VVLIGGAKWAAIQSERNLFIGFYLRKEHVVRRGGDGKSLMTSSSYMGRNECVS